MLPPGTHDVQEPIQGHASCCMHHSTKGIIVGSFCKHPASKHCHTQAFAKSRDVPEKVEMPVEGPGIMQLFMWHNELIGLAQICH